MKNLKYDLVYKINLLLIVEILPSVFRSVWIGKFWIYERARGQIVSMCLRTLFNKIL